MFCFAILYCSNFNVIDKSYREVLTLINNSQLLLKLRQVQTCYKPTVQRQRKLQHFLVYSGEGETGIPMTLNHWASTQRRSPLSAGKCFHFWWHISFCILSQLSETMLLSHLYCLLLPRLVGWLSVVTMVLTFWIFLDRCYKHFTIVTYSPNKINYGVHCVHGCGQWAYFFVDIILRL
jgi:hypothetical protein